MGVAKLTVGLCLVRFYISQKQNQKEENSQMVCVITIIGSINPSKHSPFSEMLQSASEKQDSSLVRCLGA